MAAKTMTLDEWRAAYQDALVRWNNAEADYRAGLITFRQKAGAAETYLAARGDYITAHVIATGTDPQDL